MKAKRLPDDVIPLEIGEYSLQHDIYRPPYGKRDEIYMVVPTGQTGALIPENHRWTFDELGMTVMPSIVYFNYHGFLINDVWSD
jgi:hypothetical protein